jgi:rare lipoprotein A
LRNNKAVVVRVNDRGPFVNNRIIDLSYAAAHKLDMVRDGTSLVEVTAISFDAPPASRPARMTAQGPASKGNEIFVQVGAFGERSNAARRLQTLSRNGVANAFVYEETSSGAQLFRVRIGPVASVGQYDELVRNLRTIGITDPYLITE